MSLYDTHRKIIECCSTGHKTLEEIHAYVNRGKKGKQRQSVPGISARRRDPEIKDLIVTCYFEGDARGYYIAVRGAMAKLNKAYKPSKAGSRAAA